MGRGQHVVDGVVVPVSQYGVEHGDEFFPLAGLLVHLGDDDARLDVVGLLGEYGQQDRFGFLVLAGFAQGLGEEQPVDGLVGSHLGGLAERVRGLLVLLGKEQFASFLIGLFGVARFGVVGRAVVVGKGAGLEGEQYRHERKSDDFVFFHLGILRCRLL